MKLHALLPFVVALTGAAAPTAESKNSVVFETHITTLVVPEEYVSHSPPLTNETQMEARALIIPPGDLIPGTSSQFISTDHMQNSEHLIQTYSSSGTRGAAVTSPAFSSPRSPPTSTAGISGHCWDESSCYLVFETVDWAYQIYGPMTNPNNVTQSRLLQGWVCKLGGSQSPNA